MARMFIVKDDATLDSLSSTLLSARLSNTQTTSALEDLQALNPHLDLKKVTAGTVLLVPETPSFKVSASESVPGDALGGFRQIVQRELAAAAKDLRTAIAARAEQRAEVATMQKTSAFRKIVEQDPELKEQMAQVSKQSKEDERDAATAAESLETATKGAMDELAALAKRFG